MSESKAYGVEIDSISGKIAQQLYQNSSIVVNGFEKVQMPDSFFDVAIGNVPFGDFKVLDKRYDKNHWLIHDYSKIKALATGNPLIIEKCNLDKEVSKLNMLKASYLNQKYAMENLVLRKYPENITRLKERYAGYEKDIQLAEAHPKLQEGFLGIEIDGKTITDKEAAGKAIFDVCTKMTGSDAVALGEYRGFSLAVAYDSISNECRMTMRGTLTHSVTLGADVFGNITRMDNMLDSLATKQAVVRGELSDTERQLANAREEMDAPFAKEDVGRMKKLRKRPGWGNTHGKNRSKPQTCSYTLLKIAADPMGLAHSLSKSIHRLLYYWFLRCVLAERVFEGLGHVRYHADLVGIAVGKDICNILFKLHSSVRYAVAHKVVQGSTQRIGDDDPSSQAGPCSAGFNIAHVGRRHPRHLRQLFLGKVGFDTFYFDSFPDGLMVYLHVILPCAGNLS